MKYIKEKQNEIKVIRKVVAEYISSEGCACCEEDAHKDIKAELAKLLRVPKYKDGSGYDFSKYL